MRHNKAARQVIVVSAHRPQLHMFRQNFITLRKHLASILHSNRCRLFRGQTTLTETWVHVRADLSFDLGIFENAQATFDLVQLDRRQHALP